MAGSKYKRGLKIDNPKTSNALSVASTMVRNLHSGCITITNTMLKLGTINCLILMAEYKSVAVGSSINLDLHSTCTLKRSMEDNILKVPQRNLI